MKKNKFIDFVNANFNIIALVFLILIFFNTCGDSSKLTNKKVDKLNGKIDSLKMDVISFRTTSVTKKDLQIEGLKSEKRMIQSTDRKMMDVNRQSEIDHEIESLQK